MAEKGHVDVAMDTLATLPLRAKWVEIRESLKRRWSVQDCHVIALRSSKTKTETTRAQWEKADVNLVNKSKKTIDNFLPVNCL